MTIRATGPGGENADWLAQTHIVGKDAAEVALHFACNDPPGDRRITATDILSDQKAMAVVRLK